MAYISHIIGRMFIFFTNNSVTPVHGIKQTEGDKLQLQVSEKGHKNDRNMLKKFKNDLKIKMYPEIAESY